MGRGGYSYRDDPDVPAFADDRPVVIFDGDCVLCSNSARLLLRLDRAGRFRLLTAQSPLGAALRRHFGVADGDEDSVILLRDGRLHLRSEAVLRIAPDLGAPWSWLAALRGVPRAWRDAAYQWIARRRFRLFGRRQSCFLPPARWRDRFLEIS